MPQSEIFMTENYPSLCGFFLNLKQNNPLCTFPVPGRELSCAVLLSPVKAHKMMFSNSEGQISASPDKSEKVQQRTWTKIFRR